MLVPTVALLLLVPAADPDVAAIVLPGEARSASLQNEDFRKAAAAGKWDDALTEYNGLLARPFELAPLTPRYLLQSRWLAHRELGTLSPELRARLIEQREPAGRQALKLARATQDEGRLRLVVEEQFGTRAAGQACDVLGDLAFERGDFETAACWYRLPLTAPEPPADPARARAKVLLARVFASKRLGAVAPLSPSLRADLAAFARTDPTAEGKLAGRAGKYADILTAVARDRTLDVSHPTFPAADWATFGGSPQRFHPVPIEENLADRLAIMTRRPVARLSLDSFEPVGASLAGVRSARENAGMALYPALADGTLYLADARFLTAIDLRTAAVRTVYDAGKEISRSVPAADYYRGSVTVSGDYLLSRHGVVNLQDPKANPRRTERLESVLACQRRQPDGSFRLAWSVRSVTPDGPMFEGTPLAVRGRAYVAATQVQAERTTTAIHCYALDAEGAAKQLWVRDVCETRELGGNTKRPLHHLLTLAGPFLVYASHSGAIVALDPITGQRVWAQRYPSVPRENRNALPGSEGQLPIYDLSPPLFADGRVYVAPIDSETVFCLDPWTGAVIWQRAGIQVVHLLGVYHDRLIFTTPGRLRAINARDGADQPGWSLPSNDRLPPLGRGQLVGDLVLWPTTRGVLAIRAEDGHPADGPSLLGRIPPGNLVYNDGILVVADRTTLTVFRDDRPGPIGREEPQALERAAPGLAPPARRASLQRAARLWTRAGEPTRAAKIWQTLLDQPGTLLDERRRPWPTAALAQRELEALHVQPERAAGPEQLDRARLLRKKNLPAARTIWRTLARQGGAASVRGVAATELARTTPPARVPPLPREWLLGDAVEMAPGERLIPGLDQFLTTVPQSRGSVLRLREGNSAVPRWQVALEFAPTWGNVWEEQILLGGPAGAASVRLDGQVLWQVTTLAGADQSTTEGFDAFTHAGERLFMRVGKSRLRALDAFTGALLWEFATADAGLPLPPPLGRIAPGYVATEQRVWLRSPGQRHLLDAATGRPIRQEAAPEALGPDDRLLLEEDRRLLVAERRSVALFDLASGANIWTWTIPAATTSRQEPVRLLRAGAAVWVQVPVNIGHELYRLDPRKGTALAELPRLIRAEPFDLSAGRVLHDTVFLIEPPEVVARAVLDGAVRWRVALPPGPASYRIEQNDDEILIVPATSRVEGVEFRCLIGTLEWMMKYPPAAGALTASPVLRLDATTGKVRRLDVPTGLPRLAWNWRPGLQAYLRPEVSTLRQSEPAELGMFPTPAGWWLALGGRAWLLK